VEIGKQVFEFLSFGAQRKIQSPRSRKHSLDVVFGSKIRVPKTSRAQRKREGKGGLQMMCVDLRDSSNKPLKSRRLRSKNLAVADAFALYPLLPFCLLSLFPFLSVSFFYLLQLSASVA